MTGRVDYATLSVGDEVILDGDTPAVVTNTAVYINASQNRETGVSVKPLAGGRARPVSVRRLSLPARAA